MKGPSVRPETMKLLEGKQGNTSPPQHRQEISEKTSRAHKIMPRKDKLDFMKLKSPHCQSIKRIKREPGE